MKKKAKQQEPYYPKVVESFSKFGSWELRGLQSEPSAMNGFVQVEKYRVTIEKIEEPKEVYQERLQKLWEECDNYHQYQPIKNKAIQLGVELIGDFGAKRKR